MNNWIALSAFVERSRDIPLSNEKLYVQKCLLCISKRIFRIILNYFHFETSYSENDDKVIFEGKFWRLIKYLFSIIKEVYTVETKKLSYVFQNKLVTFVKYFFDIVRNEKNKIQSPGMEWIDYFILPAYFTPRRGWFLFLVVDLITLHFKLWCFHWFGYSVICSFFLKKYTLHFFRF